MFQLAPSLTNVNDKYWTLIGAVKLPSIVSEEVVSTVITPVPTFFIVYRFWFPTAVGNVIFIVPDAK